MQRIERLADIVIIVACILLSASYFLPVEETWIPFDAWRGYYVGGSPGEFISGWDVALVEVPPYAAGLIILISITLLRQPKTGILLMTILMGSWVFSIACSTMRLLRLSDIKFPILWLVIAVFLVPTMLIIALFSLRKVNKQTSVLKLATIIAISSVLHQLCNIAFFLFEDNLFLNIGCVTGIAAGIALFIGLLIKKEACDLKVQGALGL